MEWRRFEGEEKPLEPFQLETPSLGSDRASRSRALTPAAFTPAAVHAESWEPYSSLLVGRSISAAIEAEVAEIDALTVEEVEEQVRGKHLTNAQTHPLVVDSPVFLDLSELADEISDAKAQALTEAEAAARAKLSKEEAEIKISTNKWRVSDKNLFLAMLEKGANTGKYSPSVQILYRNRLDVVELVG